MKTEQEIIQEVLSSTGYKIIINKAFGERWVQSGWRNKRLYNKLPRKVISLIQKLDPTIGINGVKRKRWGSKNGI